MEIVATPAPFRVTPRFLTFSKWKDEKKKESGKKKEDEKKNISLAFEIT